MIPLYVRSAQRGEHQIGTSEIPSCILTTDHLKLHRKVSDTNIATFVESNNAN